MKKKSYRSRVRVRSNSDSKNEKEIREKWSPSFFFTKTMIYPYLKLRTKESPSFLQVIFIC